MNKLLTLITVCICCISILGLKLRLDIYVHDKNEVITTMANKSNDTISFFGDVIGGPVSLWDYLDKTKPELRKMKQELEAERAKQQQAQQQAIDEPINGWYKNDLDTLNDTAEQIQANRKRKFRTKSDNLELFRLVQLQNDLINGDARQELTKIFRKKYDNGSRTYGDMLKAYFAEDGIDLDEFDEILENILNYLAPLLIKKEGVLNPAYYPEDADRVLKFYKKVNQIRELTNPENKINQFKKLMDTSDFAEFYGTGGMGAAELEKLTGKYIPMIEDYQPQSEEERKASFQQYLKKVKDSEDILPSGADTPIVEDRIPDLNTILGNVNQDQENQEDLVEAPESGETSYVPNGVYEPDNTSIPTTDDVNALLSSSLTGPSYALSTTPGLYGEKYEALAKALRAYALKNGIVSDTPKDPESFKPYIPKFYV